MRIMRCHSTVDSASASASDQTPACRSRGSAAGTWHPLRRVLMFGVHLARPSMIVVGAGVTLVAAAVGIADFAADVAEQQVMTDMSTRAVPGSTAGECSAGRAATLRVDRSTGTEMAWYQAVLTTPGDVR